MRRPTVAAMFALALALNAGLALAQSVWTNAASGGLWSNPNNWQGRNVATGGLSADFSTLDITADNTVHLDQSEPVGNLVFGDTTPNHNWIVDNNGNAANTLTLGVPSGVPTITVNNDVATIRASLAGTQGIETSGVGTLTLSGNNTFTGGISIGTGGTLRVGSNGALNASTPNLVSFIQVFPGNIATLSLAGFSVTTDLITDYSYNAIIQNASSTAATLTINNNSLGAPYNGTIQDGSGSAPLSIVKTGRAAEWLGGNNTFTGGVTINGGQLVLDSPGALNSAAPNAVTFGPGSTGALSINGNNVTVASLTSTGLEEGTVENSEPTLGAHAPAATITVDNVSTDVFNGGLFDGTKGTGPNGTAGCRA